MAAEKKYSQDDKQRALLLLAANNGNVLKTSQDTGIPRETIRDWAKQAQPNAPHDAKTAATSRYLKGLGKAKELALGRVIEALPNANAVQAATTLGILHDKEAKEKAAAFGANPEENEVKYAGLPDEENPQPLKRGQHVRPGSLQRLAQSIIDGSLEQNPINQPQTRQTKRETSQEDGSAA